MMILRIGIAGYRSIRSLNLELRQLNVVTGNNGTGKSNVYRSLRLLCELAEGNLARSLAQEGGFDSVLWAGPELISEAMRQGREPVQGALRKGPIALRLGFVGDRFSYAVDLGKPPRDRCTLFSNDPEIKRECLWTGPAMDARSMCVDRRNAMLRCRSGGSKWQPVELAMDKRASVLSEYSDPQRAPEIILLRDQLRSWRFYDSFRCDQTAPARRASIQTHTPILSGDGNDLAAALQTIHEIGDSAGLAAAIDRAFPGSTAYTDISSGGMRLMLSQPGMLRDLEAAELSDGTLRYLLLVAALYSPRPPELLVLNEPEGSLHPDLLEPLAEMIHAAAEHSQVIVVTHNQTLVSALEQHHDCHAIRLQKELGETVVQGTTLLDRYAWQWPKR